MKSLGDLMRSPRQPFGLMESAPVSYGNDGEKNSYLSDSLEHLIKCPKYDRHSIIVDCQDLNHPI